jgi:hypothetical protein
MASASTKTTDAMGSMMAVLMGQTKLAASVHLITLRALMEDVSCTQNFVTESKTVQKAKTSIIVVSDDIL